MSRNPSPAPTPPPPLFVYRGKDPQEPPRPLGPDGRALWDRLHANYTIRDPADVEQLLQLCKALDLVETGDVAPREALAARNFIVKTLRNLFPDDEERRRRPGRPPNVGSW